MDIREQIRTAISDLPDTEKVIVLSIIMDAIIEKTNIMCFYGYFTYRVRLIDFKEIVKPMFVRIVI